MGETNWFKNKILKMNKRDLQKNIKRSLIVIVDFLFNHRLFFSFIGFVNKHFLNNKIKSVFLVYPAKRRYVTDFTFDWFGKKMKWTPFMIGFFVQKGKVGIIFSVSAEEKELLDDSNIANLKILVKKLEEMRIILGAEMKSFAGILPGILAKKGISKVVRENDPTITAVFRAVEALGKKEGLSNNFPLIVLGGKGFVGKGLLSFFEKQENKSSLKRDIFSIDIDNFNKVPEVLKSIGDKTVVFLNITKKRALNEYIHFFNSKTIILNEVYPEPSIDELNKIKQRGASCYHIVGLKGRVYPSLPGAYRQGVPCCASFVSCQEDDILIKKLI